MSEPHAQPLRSLDDEALGRALTDVAGALDWPLTPAIATSVGAALREAPSARAWFRPLGRGLAFGLLAAVLLAGIAAGIGFALGGLRLTFIQGSPTAIPSLDTSGRAFGDEVSLVEAGDRVDWELLLPGLAELGTPDRAFVAEPPDGGAVALVWGDRPGLPAGADGIGLVVTQFRADIGPDTFEKLIDSGVRVDRITVHGTPGYWVAGGEHYFFYRDQNGQRVDLTLRLVGTTLMWEQGGLTLRIEGAPTLADALRIAESLP